MPEVEACIDQVQYTNYHIPTLQHGERVVKQRDREVALGVAYEYTEADYVDAYEPRTYTQSDAEFNATLNGEQFARLEKINELLRTLVRGRSVSDKQLKAALTADQYSEYTNALTSQQHPSEIEYGDGMPDDLRHYKSLVQQADFQYNKYERMSSLRSRGRARFSSETMDAVYNKSDGLYERAIERLQEIWECASPYEQYQIQKWMDRDIDFDAGHDRKIGIGPVLIPRVRGSKSINALDSGLPKLSKRLKRRECQLVALRDAAMKLAFKHEDETPADLTEEQRLKMRESSEKLKKLLRIGLDDDDLY